MNFMLNISLSNSLAFAIRKLPFIYFEIDCVFVQTQNGDCPVLSSSVSIRAREMDAVQRFIHRNGHEIGIGLIGTRATNGHHFRRFAHSFFFVNKPRISTIMTVLLWPPNEMKYLHIIFYVFYDARFILFSE